MQFLGTVTTSVLNPASPWIYFSSGVIISFFLAKNIAEIAVPKQGKTDLREQNIRTAIQIQNSEALEFEEKYRDKVVSQSILEKELLKK